MRTWTTYFLYISVGLLAVVPLIGASSGGAILSWCDWRTAAGLNFCAWVLVGTFLFTRFELQKKATNLAKQFGIESRFEGFETLFNKLLHEVERKHSAFSSYLIEGKITSKEQLSRSLERIVTHAFKLFDADSAELALLDEDSDLYHSSFVIGKPFGAGSQAMLTQAAAGSEYKISPDVLIQPIAFAGSILGSIRVGLKPGKVPSVSDREVLKTLALLSGLAIINSQYTQELMRMKRSSDESVKAKTGFLANLSHEIRGPLGIILNAVELVIDGLCGPLSDDQSETLKMIQKNGAHLLELINDVLDYAKIESGKVTPQRVEIPVGDLLQDITNVVRTQADSKGHKLIYSQSEEALAFECDRRHSRQMLINLLTNAIKYTPEGGTIVVWAERIPGNKIKICVKDTGVGIEHSDRDKVFSAFERIDHTYSISQVGTGLGMPLTKKLAEVNGGVIDFESTPGKGTTFWLIFPAIQFSPFMKHEQEREEPDARGNGEIILLMEKDPNERVMLSRYLKHVGFKVIEAKDRAEALTIVQEQRVRLVILDNLVVENIDQELVRALRDRGPASLRILLLSSRAFAFDVEQYLKSGVDRCVSKPIPLKSLGHACRELIEASQAASRLIRTGGQSKRGSGKITDDMLH